MHGEEAGTLGTHPPDGPRGSNYWQALWKWPLVSPRTAPWYISSPSEASVF